MNGDLIIPIQDINGKIWSLQAINFNGDKRFSPGGKIQGHFFLFGEIKTHVNICEGYATGASIFEKTKIPTACALSAKNMIPVSDLIRKKYPNIKMKIWADDDKNKIGICSATKAAENVGAVIVLPPDGFKDFNDARDLIESMPKEKEIFIPDSTSPLPDMGGAKGDIPLCTIENLEEIFRRVGIVAKYNVMSKRHFFSIPGETYLSDDWDNTALIIIASIAAKFGITNSGVVKQNAITIAYSNPFNPVVDWITSKPWDGKIRMFDFCDTIKAKGEEENDKIGELRRTLISKWMRSLVDAVFSPNGFSAPGVLVLQGAQALGKTSWLKALVPAELGLMKDGVNLRPDSKDSVRSVIGFWINELGELDGTFRKADIAQLKAFLTMDRDVIRLPYAQKESTFDRRTGFCATVNNKEFLNDTTGNRRFWTIECESIDFNHGFDMQQVWAEVYEVWKLNKEYHLTKQELDMLNASNEVFESIDHIEELITMKLAWGTNKNTWKRMSTTEVLISLGQENFRKSDLNRAAAVLRGIPEAEYRRMGRARTFLVPTYLESR